MEAQETASGEDDRASNLPRFKGARSRKHGRSPIAQHRMEGQKTASGEDDRAECLSNLIAPLLVFKQPLPLGISGLEDRL